MPRKVIVVRHGERTDHVDKQWAATAEHPSDPPLTELGHMQARSVGHHLAKTESVDTIYASPFTRTLQTATEIADVLDLPLRVDRGVCEYLNGAAFGGEPYYWPPVSESKAKFPRIDPSYESPVQAVHPETRAEMQARAKEAVQFIVESHYKDGQSDDSTIVIVSHGAVVEGCIMGVTGGGTLPYVTYCSVSRAHREGGLSSKSFTRGVLCDTSFMDEKTRPIHGVLSYT